MHYRRTPIRIFKPNNIVLTQIAARLHLDDLQRHLARVGQAVDMAQRNKRGFVFTEQEDLIPVRYLGGALDHNPMLGTVMVHLQAQLCTWIDDDALDLEAAAAVDAVVPTPGAVHLAVG